MMWGYDYNLMGWGGGMFVFMILFWALVIIAIAALIKWLSGQSSQPQPKDSGRALEILKERYARGEIDKKEFDEKKKDLI